MSSCIRWRYPSYRYSVYCAVALVLIIAAKTTVMYGAVDWEGTYRPACEDLFAGRSPYENNRFCNPPWILIPFLPFVPLPPMVAAILLSILAILSCAYVAVRLNADPIMLLLTLSAPAALHLYRNINIDWMVILALFMKPSAGLFLVLAKPQVGIGLALYWFATSWRRGGLAIRRFAPVTLALLLSFALYGFWPLRFTNNVSGLGTKWDLNVWPYGLPIGLIMVAFALHRRAPNIALAASPLLSPYVAAYSWFVPLAMLSRYRWSLVLVIGMWTLLLWYGVPFM